MRDLQNYATHQPEGEELKKAREEQGLKLYYQFNQSSGLEVQDVSGNGNKATRANVGPDGDAWRDSAGVFSLDFSEEDDDQAKPLDTRSYRVLTCSDEELEKRNTPADYILDGDVKTSWHSLYGKVRKSYPHSVTILRANKDRINKLKIYTNRGKNYRADLLTIEESANGYDWQVVEEERYLADKSIQTVSLESPIKEAYFRLTFKHSNANAIFLFINEIAFYGEAEALKRTEVPLTYSSCSDEELDKENGAGRNAFDKNEQTLWYSHYNDNPKAYKHSITFENKNSQAIALFRIKQKEAKEYAAGKMNILISDNGKDFKLLSQNIRLPYHYDVLLCLDKAAKAKYIKLEFLNNQEHKGDFLAIKEISAYTYEGQELTSAPSLEQKVLRCYPNPTTDYVIVEGLYSGESLALYSLSGVLVQTAEIKHDGTLRLNLQGLAKGLYILRSERGNFKLEVR